MATHIDPKMLDGFAHEVQPTLSKMRQGIALFLRQPANQEALEDAYECLQTMKDTAAMLELPVLGQLTAALEEMVEDVATASSTPSPQQGTWLQQAAAYLEAYVHQSLAEDTHSATAAMALVQAHRRFKHLPEAGDRAAVTAILGDDVVLPAPAPASPPPAPPAAHDPMDESEELIEGFLMEAEDYLNAIGRTLPEVEKSGGPAGLSAERAP